MSADGVMFEAAALADRDAGPVGVSVLVCTADPTWAREVGPKVARLLYPGRRFGRVLHTEPAKAPTEWPAHYRAMAWTEAVVEEVQS
jgi:hypothetical protein